MTLTEKNELLTTLLYMKPDATVGQFDSWIKALGDKRAENLHTREMAALIPLDNVKPIR